MGLKCKFLFRTVNTFWTTEIIEVMDTLHIPRIHRHDEKLKIVKHRKNNIIINHSKKGWSYKCVNLSSKPFIVFKLNITSFRKPLEQWSWLLMVRSHERNTFTKTWVGWILQPHSPYNFTVKTRPGPNLQHLEFLSSSYVQFSALQCPKDNFWQY